MNSAFITYSASFINCQICILCMRCIFLEGREGRRRVVPYISHIAMCLGFLGRFGLETGKNFAHFGLESGMVYKGTTVLYQCVNRFNYNRIRKKV